MRSIFLWKKRLDGVTIAEFDADMRIFKLKEFQSKSEYSSRRPRVYITCLCGIKTVNAVLIDVMIF